MNKMSRLKKKRKFPVHCDKCGLIYARESLSKYINYYCGKVDKRCKLTKIIKW